jgi:DNA-binding NtrC family response regulator
LAIAGFRVIVAENGTAGLETFTRFADEIDIVVADVIMPVTGGIEMAQTILALRPETRIILMSGHSDVVLARSKSKLPLLRKPFLPEDLIRAIMKFIDPPQVRTGTL